MKKKILIVCSSLSVGGAEKSCVSFLNSLPDDKYEVELMPLSRKGALLGRIPAWVKVAKAPLAYACMAHKLKDWKFYIRHSPSLWLKKAIRSRRAKRITGLNISQSLYTQWRADLPVLKKEYDVAIGYLEGISDYIVTDKVRAGRKIVWIHSNYDNLGYSPAFDAAHFAAADVIATMSPEARESLRRNFPRLAGRVRVLENITDAETVRSLASLHIPGKELDEFDGLRIVSCGRLTVPKAYERAIEAAALLQKEGIKFKWLIVGDGPERKRLTRLKRRMRVGGSVCLTGMRDNPYPYMKWADMLVVTSLFEGKSLAIDEAQILGVPVITTDYATASDAVEHEQTGLICGHSPEAIAEAITRLHRDGRLLGHIRRRLLDTRHGNKEEIRKYIDAIEDAGSI